MINHDTASIRKEKASAISMLISNQQKRGDQYIIDIDEKEPVQHVP